MAENPKPVSISPDGKLLILKRFSSNRGNLAVKELASGKIVDELPGDSQYLITWHPLSDGLAFVADRDGNQEFQLHLWFFDSRGHRQIAGPAINKAHRYMKWSPDGQKLAYFARSTDGGLAIYDMVSGNAEVVYSAVDVSDYTWATDGRLALVDPSKRSSVQVITPKGTLEKRWHFPNHHLRHIHWSPNGHIAATDRHQDSEYFGLSLLNTETGNLNTVFAETGDVTHPQWLADSPSLVFHHDVAAEKHIRFVADYRNPSVADSMSVGPGDNEIMSVFDAGDRLSVAHTGLRTPRALFDVSLPRLDRHPRMVFQSPTYAEVRGPAGSQHLLQDGRGPPIPILKWNPSGSQPCKGVVIQVHGGPTAQIRLAFNPVVRLIADHGYRLVAVNYRGSTGYGRAFASNRDIIDMTEDVHRTIDHVQSEWGCPVERTILTGHSFGAGLALRAAATAPEQVGGLVVVSMVPIKRPPAPTSVSWPVTLFHGEHDSRPLERALAIVKRRLGQNVLEDPKSSIHLLPSEGHNIRHSWAQIAFGIVTALNGEGLGDTGLAAALNLLMRTQ